MSELIENVTTQEVGEIPVKKVKKFKFGWFVLTLLLPVISLCLQFVGMVPTMIRASVRVLTEQVTNMDQVMQISAELTAEYMGEILLIYHALNIVVFFLWYGIQTRGIERSKCDADERRARRLDGAHPKWNRFLSAPPIRRTTR